MKTKSDSIIETYMSVLFFSLCLPSLDKKTLNNDILASFYVYISSFDKKKTKNTIFDKNEKQVFFLYITR